MAKPVKTKTKAWDVGWCDVGLPLLVRADWNYKVEDEELAGKLLANMQRNGQVESVIIREIGRGKYEVVNGNHRLDVFNKLETPSIHCYNLGKVSDPDARRIAVETNETRFDTDQAGLSRVINEVLQGHTIDDILATFPMPEKELRNLVELADFNWDDFDADSHEQTPDFTTVKFTMTEELHALWLLWVERCERLLDYKSPEKCLESALADALATPEESLE